MWPAQSVRGSRSTRVPAPAIEARLGSQFGRLANVSATGALVRTNAPFLLGRQVPLTLNMPEAPVTLTVRIVRAERTAPVEQHGDEPRVQYLVGVMFTEFRSVARQAIAKLCGAAFSQHE
jgi:Tfp pilus assembly protein PilZ